MTSRSDGFTLLELLVAMTLLALLLAILFGGLRTGSRVWEAGDQRSDDLARLQAAQSFLRRQIGDLFPLHLEDGSRDAPVVAVAGDETSFSFAGLLPTHFDFTGFQTISVGVIDKSDGRHLAVEWWPFDAEDTAPATVPDERRSLLIENVESARFSYFGADEQDGAARWVDEWRDWQAPPSLVSIAVTFDGGDRRYWPTLVIRVPSTAPPIERAEDDLADEPENE